MVWPVNGVTSSRQSEFMMLADDNLETFTGSLFEGVIADPKPGTRDPLDIDWYIDLVLLFLWVVSTSMKINQLTIW